MRLLLVDDDPALRALVRATFDDVGVEVVEAESATVARQSMARARPDVIVLDVVMPRESGLEFCRELKDEPETKNMSDDDVVLDACIGLEAMLGQERIEITHRLAQRSATLLRARFNPAGARLERFYHAAACCARNQTKTKNSFHACFCS